MKCPVHNTYHLRGVCPDDGIENRVKSNEDKMIEEQDKESLQPLHTAKDVTKSPIKKDTVKKSRKSKLKK